MTKEFKIKKQDADTTVYTLEDATSGGTSSGSVASVAMPVGQVQSRDRLVTGIEPPKPRNFVAKNAKRAGAGQHTDKKRAEKQGDVKHKKPYLESLRTKIDSLQEQSATLNELSVEKLAQYKKAAGASSSAADAAGDVALANKRFSGIVKATKKQFAHDAKKNVAETREFVWSDYNNMPNMADRLAIAEAYFANNNNLFESNDESTNDYFLNLGPLSVQPVPNKKYITVLLGLINNDIKEMQPIEVGTFLKQENNVSVVKMDDGQIIKFPSEEIMKTMTLKTFFFDSTSKYDEFRTAVALRFDKTLPTPAHFAHDAKKNVDEEASPMIKPPANRFDSKQEAFAYAKEHGGKVFKSTYIDPNTGMKHISFVVKMEQGVAEGPNDYFKRRKDEEDRIAGKKAPAKRTPRQTDYEKKRKEQGVAEAGNDTVTFEVDSENAYNHIMKQFGSLISWDGDAMVAPRKHWGAIQELAYAAGGEATEVGDEQTMAEDQSQHPDHEVEMARADVYELAKNAIDLHKLLADISEEQGLEGWQQAKITKAADYIASVHRSMDYTTNGGDEAAAEGWGLGGYDTYMGGRHGRGVAENEGNPVDTVTMDVPLLIRIMEYSREDAADDMALHHVAEKLIDLGSGGQTLTMDQYDEVVGGQSPESDQDSTDELSELSIGGPRRADPNITKYAKGTPVWVDAYGDGKIAQYDSIHKKVMLAFDTYPGKLIPMNIGNLNLKVGQRAIDSWKDYKNSLEIKRTLAGRRPVDAGMVGEVAPPGWEKTVKSMKKHKEIENPFALAWSMKKKGAKSHKAESVQDAYTAALSEQLASTLNEKIPKDATVDYYIQDFAKSNAPALRGKSPAKRRQMAIAAYYGSKQKK